jgi:hypothetical protein
MPAKYFRNCTWRGWSKPNCFVNCAAFSAPRREPAASMSAGEPGRRRGRRKLRMITVSRVSTA